MIKLKSKDKYTVKYELDEGSAYIYVNKRYFGRCHIATIGVIQEKGFESCLGLIRGE